MIQGAVFFIWLVTAAVAMPQDSDPVLNKHSTQKLTLLASELARAGDPVAVEAVISLMRDGGHGETALAKLAKDCNRSLEKARPSAAVGRRVPQRFSQALAALEAQLEELSSPENRPVAKLLVALDGDNVPAQTALGRVLHEGRWVDQSTLGLLERRAQIEAMVTEARSLPVQVPTESSDIAAMTQLFGTRCSMTSWGDFEIHSTYSAPRLARIVREGLRASALSNALRGGSLEVPKSVGTQVRRIIVMKTTAEYLDFLAEARAGETLLSGQEADIEERGSFVDTRGFEVYALPNEVHAYTTMVHIFGWHWRWIRYGHKVPPCLSVGHTNWICLTYFGVGSGDVLINDRPVPHDDRRYSDAEYRLAELKALGRAGVTGARTWLVSMVQEGQDPQWELAMKEQMGEVRGLVRLKATFVVEYLQEQQLLPTVLQQLGVPDKRPRAQRPLFEAALKQSLESFESAWREWILPQPPSLKERLATGDEATPFSDPANSALQIMQEIRNAAFSKQQFPDTRPLKLDAGLCQGAQAHSRYLNLHPEQMSSWPAAHEEYPDQKGFTTAGCRAGSHSVIHPGCQSAQQAIDGWMGTFYHRLPLLNPGLMRMGFALDKSTAVLDCLTLCADSEYSGSVVWPYDGMKRVPHSFEPELPNPVPGEVQSGWGYPITVQHYGNFIPLTMTLHKGASPSGPSVPCHFISPSAPLNVESAPPGGYCLIPKATLASKTTYTVRAVGAEGFERTWSFTTAR